jgi:hypothetical protein
LKKNFNVMDFISNQNTPNQRVVMSEEESKNIKTEEQKEEEEEELPEGT